MEWEPKLRTRYVGLLMNLLGYRFRDDIPTKLAAFERTVHDYENQTVDDDSKRGVTMLGMEDMRVKEHLIQNSVRITSWNQMREEILEITRTQQARAKTAKAKAKAKAGTSRAKTRSRNAMNESSKKAKSDDQRKCFYCHKTGVKAECRKRLKDHAEAEGKPVAATPHPSNTTTVVPLQCLLPDESHTSDVHHSHALREQRTNRRVFQ